MTSITPTGLLPPPQLNPSAQTTITPTPVRSESDSLSQDFPIEFKRLALSMSGPGFHARKLHCFFSIFRVFYETLGEMLYELDQEEYLQHANSKLNLSLKTVDDLISEFYIRLSIFNETDNRGPFIDFVVTVCELIIMGSKNNKTLEDGSGLYNNFLLSGFIYKFLNSPKELLNEPMFKFISPNYVYSEIDRFRVAVLKSCYLNFDMVSLTRCQFALNQEATNKLKSFHSISSFEHSPYIIQNERLNPSQKRVLSRFCYNLLITLQSDLNDFNECLNLSLNGHMLGSFYPIVRSEEAQKIAGLKNPDDRDVDTSDYKPYFVKDNRLIFENFILKARGIVDYIEEHAPNGERYWSSFKNFFLYINLADISSLLNEETLKKPYDELEKIIFEDLEKFSLQLKKDKTLLIASGELLQDPKFVIGKNFIGTANCIAVYLRKISQLINGLIKAPLVALEKSQNDLDIPFSSHFLRPVKIHSTPKHKEKEKETIHSQENEINDEPIDTEKAIKTSEEAEVKDDLMMPSTSKTPLPLSPVEQLQQGRETIEKVCTELVKKCHAYRSKEALRDAQGHLDELCCTIQRFLRQREKSLTARHVFFLVIDSIRHGTLALEQILCTLNRESNEIKNKKQFLENPLTHNLFMILMGCKLNGYFPQKICDWIRKNNHGEVIIRGNDTLKLRNSIVDDLFTKARNLSNGHSSIEPEKMIQELFGYLIDLIRVCEQLMKQLQSTIKMPFDQEKSFECLLPCLRALAKDPCQLACHQEKPQSSENFASFKEKIDILKTNPAADLRNLKENLIPHLEYELENQSTLHPFEARLHLGNVLLLNQMIAENILLNCIKEEEVEFEKGSHDLMSLIKALKIMPEEKFTSKELAFLERGNQTRLLVRYPADYEFLFKDKKKVIGETLSRIYSMAKKISKEEKLTQQYHLEEGFQLVHSKLVNQLNEIKQLAQNDVEVMISITTKILETMGLEGRLL